MDAGKKHERSVEASGIDLTSLLWPPGYQQNRNGSAALPPDVTADLDIEPLVRALSGQQSQREPFVRKLLATLCTDPNVITYRQQTLTNLLEDAALRERFAGVLRGMAPLLRDRVRPLFQTEWTVPDLVGRLGELELYVDAALAAAEALSGGAIEAPGLCNLRRSVESLVNSPEFEQLRGELPTLRATLDGLQSVTIGVNLSPALQPESATILSLDAEKIEGRGGLLQRLLGNDEGRQGMTRLRGEGASGLPAFLPPMRGNGRGRENELVDDLRRLLEQVVEPVGQALDRYVSVHAAAFAVLEAELAFFLNAADLADALRAAGLPVCCPEIAPIDGRTADIEDGYNLSLALRTLNSSGTGEIVTNPMIFDTERGRVWVLTGPNRGGKTTYVRAVGLIHLLYQAGIYVPAASACLSPVDAIFTHFPSRETSSPGKGRLDEEAERLAAIFHQATPSSLVLLNEALSGTSTLEALALARDALRGLHLLGARAIYVTHLHELAALADEINRTTGGDGTVASLVAEIDEDNRNGSSGHRATFHIRLGPPRGLSHASAIAEQHGISYTQLQKLLEQRAAVDAGRHEHGDL